jgi:hypothetical protein
MQRVQRTRGREPSVSYTTQPLPCVKTTGGRLYVLTMYVDSLCCATQAPACARTRQSCACECEVYAAAAAAVGQRTRTSVASSAPAHTREAYWRWRERGTSRAPRKAHRAVQELASRTRLGAGEDGLARQRRRAARSAAAAEHMRKSWTLRVCTRGCRQMRTSETRCAQSRRRSGPTQAAARQSPARW